MQDIAGKAAFITGGASGIGLAIARSLAEAGARVTLADIDQAQLDKVTPTLPEAFGVRLDVRDRAGWQAAKAAAEARFGPVDILVNNAGIGPDGRPFAEMDPAAFDRVIAINLTGVFNGVSAFAADMQARGRGHIVNTSSMAGLMINPTLGAYTVAKFGVVGLSEVLRAELAPHGVGVSVLCPGLIETRLGETTLAAGSERPQGNRSVAARGLDAAIAGQRVLDAIRNDELYILTHGEYRKYVARRDEAILAAFDRTPESTALAESGVSAG
jgi:NAD(P)-dependent dehydrogenase (short-subunit alcohol dehydrogenase family)